MKMIITKYPLLSILLAIILFDGCSTKETNLTVSDTHPYNNNYGLVPNPEADEIIAQEIASQNQPAEIDYSSLDPRYTTKLEKDPDAFLEEEWVQPKPKISYKYMDDPKFYSEDELPENKLRTGNVIIKVPNNMTMVSR